MGKLIVFWYTLSIVSSFLGTSLAKEWWEGQNFYQIYPRSFMDSNGDGVGDLNGITSRAEYLKEIGMTGVWLSPIFKSPMVDFGYDISDYTIIQPEYGTLDDFFSLINKFKKLDLHLILDFVPNHTSDEHEWFIKSAQRDPQYENYYIWHDGYTVDGVRIPPNNWISVFRFSAWTWNEVRQQYYLHQFAAQQPDLNYREPKVVEDMKNILRLWLTRGVSGFRIDAVPFLFEIEPDEDGHYPDEPLSGTCDDPLSHCYLSHIYTQNFDETYDMAYQWREVLNDFTGVYGGEPRLLMTEAYTSLDNTIRFYGDGTRNGSQIPFNFELINNMNMNSTAVDFKNTIDSWLNKMPAGVHANWVMGNHDNKRLASRFGVNRADLLNILLQTLPGNAVTYNGEELALTDVYLTWEETVDPQACNTNQDVYNTYSRDPARTPFQWDDTKNAGFSSANKTWLPVGTDYKTNNVKNQLSSPFSHLKIFRRIANVRKMDTFQDGTLDLQTHNNDILIYKRELSGSETYIIVLNFGKTQQTIDVTTHFPNISTNLEVIVTSLHSPYVSGTIVNAKSVIAYAEVGTVFVAF